LDKDRNFITTENPTSQCNAAAVVPDEGRKPGFPKLFVQSTAWTGL